MNTWILIAAFLLIAVLFLFRRLFRRKSLSEESIKEELSDEELAKVTGGAGAAPRASRSRQSSSTTAFA